MCAQNLCTENVRAELCTENVRRIVHRKCAQNLCTEKFCAELHTEKFVRRNVLCGEFFIYMIKFFINTIFIYIINFFYVN